jgi:hypothetical protein
MCTAALYKSLLTLARVILILVMPATTSEPAPEGKIDFNSQFNLLQAAHDRNDRRLVTRVLHSLPKVRKSLDASTISSLEAFRNCSVW